MSLAPINITRISHNLRTTSMVSQLRQNTLTAFAEQNRLATGRRFVLPSDDPIAASRTLGLTEVLQRQDQIRVNVQHADNVLSATESAIAEVGDLLNQAHGIASQNLGLLAGADERRAAAELINEITSQLQTIGNRQFDGAYLFSGRTIDTAPFVGALGGVAFLGDTGEVLARVADLDLAATNLPGDVLFGALSVPVGGAVDLRPALRDQARLEDFDGALGAGIGSGRIAVIETGGAGRFTVDLSTADTIGDVVSRFNRAAADAGAAVTAELGPTGLRIVPGGSPVSISEAGSGTVAADLGIRTDAEIATPLDGASLNLRLTRTTPVADLAGGTGVDLESGILITNGPTTVTVDLADATTVQDIINAINSSGVFVRARINAAGTGLEVLNEVSGTALSIGENGGTAAAELGIRSLDESTPLAALNFGRGVRVVAGEDDIRITARNGSTVDVNLDDAVTVADVMALINTAATDAGVSVTASLSSVGSGILLQDATGGTGSLSVSRLNLSFALDDLGLDKSVADPDQDLIGDDRAAARAAGVLTALIDLERALRADDERGITDAGERVRLATEDVNRMRGVVGSRSRGMQSRLSEAEEVVTATRSFLADIRDLDYSEAVTRFQQAQTALQANLVTGSRTLSLSLLDFLR